jgi:hypothetical protein
MEDIQTHPEMLETATARPIEDQPPPPAISFGVMTNFVFTSFSINDRLQIALLAFLSAFE